MALAETAQLSYNSYQMNAEAMRQHPSAWRLVRASHKSIVHPAPVACHRSFFVSTEEWRDVVGFEGLYQVSDAGRIRRSERKDKVLSQRTTRQGYCVVGLSKSGKQQERQVHRLVAQAFIGDVPDGCQVNHKNGIKDDNRPGNLEYVSPQENIRHARDVLGFKYGYHPRRQKEIPTEVSLNTGGHKLNILVAQEIRQLYQERKYSQPELGRMFGVSHTMIGRIVRGEAWVPSPLGKIAAALNEIVAIAQSGDIQVQMSDTENGVSFSIDGLFRDGQGWSISRG